MTTCEAAHVTSLVVHRGRGVGWARAPSTRRRPSSWRRWHKSRALRASVPPHLAASGPRLPERELRLWVSLVTGQLIRAMWCLSEAVTWGWGGLVVGWLVAERGEAAGYVTPVHAHPLLSSSLRAHAPSPPSFLPWRRTWVVLTWTWEVGYTGDQEPKLLPARFPTVDFFFRGTKKYSKPAWLMLAALKEGVASSLECQTQLTIDDITKGREHVMSVSVFSFIFH